MIEVLIWLKCNALEITSIFISCLAIFFTWRSIALQKKHNENSVRPIATIGLFCETHILISNCHDEPPAEQQEKRFFAELVNVGLGPLLIKNLAYQMHDKAHADISEIFNSDKILFPYIHKEFEETALSPGTHVMLFDMIVSDIETAEHILQKLKSVHIALIYNDIYNNDFSKVRDCSFFKQTNKETQCPQA